MAFNYTGGDGNYYVGDTGWHSDSGHKAEDPMRIKIAFYLDSLTGGAPCDPRKPLPPFANRCADRLQQDIRQSQECWSIPGQDVPVTILETNPGDLVLFNHNTKHASFGGGNRLRMFTINLCQRYPADRLEALREYIGKSARFWIQRKYSEWMVGTATPERWKHLEQVRANDSHLAELSQQARDNMAEPSRG
jgi:hypothetical protein